MWATPPAALDLLFGLLELLDRAGDEQHGRAGVGDLDRGRFADPRGGAGDQHHLAPHRGRQRAVLEQVGVEVALPVVPDPVGVGLQRRHRDPRALQRRLRLGRVEVGRVVDVAEDAGRDADLVQRRFGDPPRGGKKLQPGAGQAGRRVGHVGVEPQRHLRRVGRAGEEVDHLPRRLRVRVGQVEGLAVEARLVGDVVDRAATKSTGTMLISPPSTPRVGSQDGSTRRARCSSLKA